MAQSRLAWQDLSDDSVDTPKILVPSDWSAPLWDEETHNAYMAQKLDLPSCYNVNEFQHVFD